MKEAEFKVQVLADGQACDNHWQLWMETLHDTAKKHSVSDGKARHKTEEYVQLI